MRDPDSASQQVLVTELAAVLGNEGVLAESGALATYEHDGYMVKARPLAVCFPTTTEQLATLMRLATRRGVPVTPRGAGTGLSGGATAVGGGILVSTSRMNRIMSLDAPNLRAIVQPGVVNADLTRAAEPFGLYFAPDPSSLAASTIGGNVAENAGGPHCLAYGVTTNHILGLEVVLADGAIRQFGVNEAVAERPGYDLTGLTTGSEGTLAFVTAVTVRLTPRREAVSTLLALFSSVRDAGAAATAVIAAGMTPAALEFIDSTTIEALAQAGFRDYPSDAEAVLLVELEGLAEQVRDDTERVRVVLLDSGATEVYSATAAAERARLWAGRRGALAALGRLAPHYYIQDGVVPRSRLVSVLMQIQELARRERLLIANVFHAGDGNLHPTILYDAREPGLTERVIEAGAEILRYCVDAGGTLSGEHGVGLEKQAYLDWIFSAEDQEAQHRLKRAFDPGYVFNPGKPFSGPAPG
jgi:glycolate oxidase